MIDNSSLECVKNGKLPQMHSWMPYYIPLGSDSHLKMPSLFHHYMQHMYVYLSAYFTINQLSLKSRELITRMYQKWKIAAVAFFDTQNITLVTDFQSKMSDHVS